MKKVIIGSRGSKLALLYAEKAKEFLLKFNNISSDDIEIKKIGSWTSARSISPDRRPLFGSIKPNFFVVTGFGSNGFTLSPLLAFLISKKIQGIDLLGLNQFIRINSKRFNKINC